MTNKFYTFYSKQVFLEIENHCLPEFAGNFYSAKDHIHLEGKIIFGTVNQSRQGLDITYRLQKVLNHLLRFFCRSKAQEIGNWTLKYRSPTDCRKNDKFFVTGHYKSKISFYTKSIFPWLSSMAKHSSKWIPYLKSA